MPHDANGNPLKEGDLVWIPAKVLGIGSDGPYCNCDLELEYPMPAYPDQRARYSAINCAQVVKREKEREAL